MSGSVTLFVDDPETGERLYFTYYRTKRGTEVIQRMDPSMYSPLDGSRRKRENQARFAEAATQAYGERQTGLLAPAAERVRDELMGDAARNPIPSSDMKKLRRAAYRELIGEQSLLIAREFVDAPFSLRVQIRAGAPCEGEAPPSILLPSAMRGPVGQNPTAIRFHAP